MHAGHSSRFLTAVALSSFVLLSGCGDGSSDSSGGTGGGWTGTWTMVTEDGRTPAEWGYRSVVLTLATTSFTSRYDSGTEACTWSGTLTSTESTLTVTTSAADAFPCNQAVGTTRDAAWSLSNGNNTLTLDWSGTLGTLQVYQRL